MVPLEVLAEVVRRVHATGGRVAVHSGHGDSGAAAVAAGADSLEHGVHHLPAAGLAFSYDKPNATAPQVILVAVAPDTQPQRQPTTWDLDTLLDVVRATITLAMARAETTDDAPAGTEVTIRDLP